MEECDMGVVENNNRQGQSSKKRRFWQAHLGAWQKSGLTQNEYCRRHQLGSSQFRYWKKSLEQHDQTTSLNFIPVPVGSSTLPAGSNRNDSGLTIVASNNMHIRLEHNFSPSALSKVIAVLEGRL